MQCRENVLANIKYMYNLKVRLEKRLGSLPKGKLKRKTSKSGIYYYEEYNGSRISLKDDPQRLAQFREREQIERELKNIEENIPLLEWMLAEYRPMAPVTEPESAGMVYNLSGGKIPSYISSEQFRTIEEQKNPYSTVNRDLIYNGVYYKSKSELLIAMLLTSLGIEFKYEVTLQMGMHRVYPDFMIRRPRDGKLFFWEHAGKIADDDYVVKLFGRLEDYHDIQLNLWDNLILTFDGEDGGIDMDYIDKVVRLYLL